MSVIYKDGTIGYIREQDLDELLSRRQIHRFLRSSGWVTVGRDEIRNSRKDTGSWRDRKSNRRLLAMRSPCNGGTC